MKTLFIPFSFIYVLWILSPDAYFMNFTKFGQFISTSYFFIFGFLTLVTNCGIHPEFCLLTFQATWTVKTCVGELASTGLFACSLNSPSRELCMAGAITLWNLANALN